MADMYFHRVKLIDYLKEKSLTKFNSFYKGYVEAIKDVIAFDSTEVQPVKHGRWISSGRDNDYNSYCRCSRCDHEIVMYRDSEKKPPNYCENCGADMRGAENE